MFGAGRATLCEVLLSVLGALNVCKLNIRQVLQLFFEILRKYCTRYKNIVQDFQIITFLLMYHPHTN